MPNQTNQANPAIPAAFPPQHQSTQPGSQSAMRPVPITDNPNYRGSGKLVGRVALISGGDSGIGLAAATAFSKEGADVAILYLSHDADARSAVRQIQSYGAQCISIRCDLRQETEAARAVKEVLQRFG
ncbi:MAG: SDR family NAD(P)-dependent oxidoreductase, partial [Christensenellales bacterium]